jgi:hypothetical protein
MTHSGLSLLHDVIVIIMHAMACCIDDVIMMINAQRLRGLYLLLFLYDDHSTLVPVMDGDDIRYHHHPVHLER